ncbi:MAG: Fe(3+) ABC transporter substrate-binding protein [Alphaproteobacteria bacterium]
MGFFRMDRPDAIGRNGIGAAVTRLRAAAAALAMAGAGLFAPVGGAAAEEVNLYSSRHYDTDERLYTEFTEQTGIKVNRLEDRADVLLERIKAEGRNSPADLLITTDAGRLWAAVEADLLQPVDSETLASRIPAALRHPDGLWFGFSKRARVIFYAKDRVDPASVETYADLARPAFKGQVCTRSSTNIYMLSLMASIIANRGTEAAKAWAEGVWANRPRDPRGGDVVQLRGIVSGECDYAIGNTYYFARAMRRDMVGLKHPEQTSKIGVIFPNQDTTGTHVNISGAGVLKTAPNRDSAIRFLEYLTSERAQKYFAEGNDEYPVVEGVAPSAEVLSLGSFKEDSLNLSVLGENQAMAQRLYDEAGFK